MTDGTGPSDCTTLELVFFDTFTHAEEDDHIDLVRFKSPVKLREIRVVPLGTKVEADAPIGLRLGATIPSKISLQFFVNDLDNTANSAFSEIGCFEYQQNVSIQCIINDLRTTDALIIRGSYKTLTIAGFGEGATSVDGSVSTPPEEIISPAFSPKVVARSPPQVDQSTTPPPPPAENRLKNQDSLESVSSSLDNSRGDAKRKSLSPISRSPSGDRRPMDRYSRSKKSPSPRRPYVSSRHSSRPEPTHEKRSRSPRSSRYSRCSHSTSKSPRRHYVDRHPDSATRLHRHSRSPQHLRPHNYRSEERESRYHRPDRNNHSRSKERVPYRRSRSPQAHRNKPDYSPQPEVERKSYSRSPWRQRSRSPDGPYHHRHHRRSRSSHSSSDRPSAIKYRQTESKHLTDSYSLESRRSSSQSAPEKPPSRELEKSPSPQKSPINNGKVDLIVKDEDINSVSPVPLLEDNEDDQQQDLEPISPQHALDDAEIISDDDNLGDLSESERSLEEISSNEEDIGDSNEVTEFDLAAEYDDNLELWTFDPTKPDLLPLPNITESITEAGGGDTISIAELEILFCKYSDAESRHEKWVEALGLLAKNSSKSFENLPKQLQNNLFEWLLHGLDFEIALQQPKLPFKIRQLREAVNLAACLFRVAQLHEQSFQMQIPKQLFALYHRPHMNIGLRLSILKAINALTNSVAGITHFLELRYTWGSETMTCYQRLLDLLTKKPPIRLVLCTSTLLKKISIYECVQELCNQDGSDRSRTEKLLKALTNDIADFEDLHSQNSDDSPSSLKLCSHSYQEDSQLLLNCLLDMNLGQNLLRLQKSGGNFESISSFLALCQSSPLLTKLMLDKSNIAITKGFLEFMSNGTSQQHHAAIRLAYHFKSVQAVRTLFSASQNLDDSKLHLEPEIARSLHELYTLTETTEGRASVMETLAHENNLCAILNLFNFNIEARGSNTKSVVFGYACELLNLMLSANDNLLLLLNRHGKEILHICQAFSHSKLDEVRNALVKLPLEVNALHDPIYKQLLALLSEASTAAGYVQLFKIEYVGALKLLRNLATTDSEGNRQAFRLGNCALNNAYALLQVFSNDGHTLLINYLAKISEAIANSRSRSQIFFSRNAHNLFSIVSDITALLKILTASLLSVRQNEFKDTSAIPVLLKIYAQLQLCPTESQFHSSCQSTCIKIIDALTIFTTLSENSSYESEDLSNSLWAKLLKQLFTFARASPENFCPSLRLLVELLPPALPISNCDSEQQRRLINIRKIWTVHLSVLSMELQETLSLVIPGADSNVQHWLGLVCYQIADLSAPASLMIAKIILDLIEAPAYSPIEANCLAMLALLSEKASFKAALLSLFFSSAKKEDKYGHLFSRFLTYLMDGRKAESNRLHILVTIKNLCDPKIAFVSNETDQAIANAVPTNENLLVIIKTALNLLKRSIQSYNVIMVETLALQILTEIALHDRGMWLLRQPLEDTLSAFLNVQNLIIDYIQNRPNQRDNAFSLLRSFIMFIRSICDSSDQNKPLKFKPGEALSMLKWKHESNSTLSGQIHLIRDLLKKDLDNSQSVIALQWLNEALEADPLPIPTSWPEPIFLPPESLEAQFASRPCFTTDANCESTLPQLEKFAHFDKYVELDLVHISKLMFGEDFDLSAKLAQDWTEEKQDPAKAATTDTRSYEQLITVKEPAAVFTSSKKAFVAAARGRGNFGRPVSVRPNDPFRSRPPNTSRPPSMHVDDFVAMGYNREPQNYTTIPKHIKEQNRIGAPLSPPIRTVHPFSPDSAYPRRTLLAQPTLVYPTTVRQVNPGSRYPRSDVVEVQPWSNRNPLQPGISRHPTRYPSTRPFLR